MLVHLLWIINKSGQIVLNQHFTPVESFGENARSSDKQMMLASVIYGLRGLSRQIAPTPADVMQCEGLTLVEGVEHNVLIYETPTGVTFVLFTDPNTTKATQLFSEIHMAYVDWVLKNPFYVLDSSGVGQPIRIGHFKNQLKAIVDAVNSAGLSSGGRH